jgi:hypothetical protein
MGYPSLFLHFREEHMPSIADYGAGSGTSGLWIQDPGFPDQWNNTLYTGDWTVNRIFQHPLERKGASWTIKQNDFMTVPRQIDMAMDDQSHLYVASLIGGVFNYAGDTVGAIIAELSRQDARRRRCGRRRAPTRSCSRRSCRPTPCTGCGRSASSCTAAPSRRRSRGCSATRSTASSRPKRARRRCSRSSCSPGARANATIQRIAAEPAMRELALRVLTDDKRQLAGVPVALYVNALNDADLTVRAAAITGLVRLNARDRAESIVPLLTSSDSALAHLATQALVSLGARDVALRALTAAGSSPELRVRARHVLQQMHDAETVSAVLAANGTASDPMGKREVVATLARLYNSEGPWKGEWWGTHPSTGGPVLRARDVGESARIRPGATPDAARADRRRLRRAGRICTRRIAWCRWARRRCSPPSRRRPPPRSATRWSTRSSARRSSRRRRCRSSRASTRPAPRFTRRWPSCWRARLRSRRRRSRWRARRCSTPRSLPRRAPGCSPRSPRSQATRAATRRPRSSRASRHAPAHRRAGTIRSRPAWRRWVGERMRAGQLDYFVDLVRTAKEPAQRTLAYAVLLQAARNQRAPAAVREKVTPVLDAAWADAALAPQLVDAIAIMRVESQYTQQLEAYRAKRGGK